MSRLIYLFPLTTYILPIPQHIIMYSADLFHGIGLAVEEEIGGVDSCVKFFLKIIDSSTQLAQLCVQRMTWFAGDLFKPVSWRMRLKRNRDQFNSRFKR